MNKISKQSQSGIISLLVVLGVGLFALTVVLTVTTGVLSEFNKNHNTVSGDKVFYASEAAVKDVTRDFIADYTANRAYYIDYAGAFAGTYTPDVTLNVNDTTLADVEVTGTWPFYEIKSKGSNLRTTRNVVQKLTVYSPGLALDFAVFANDDLTMQGNATVNGDVFSNGDIEFDNNGGGSGGVNGDASAVGNIDDDGDKISGTTNDGVTHIDPPPIDLAPYLTEATGAGTYYDNIGDAHTAEAQIKNNDSTGTLYFDVPGEEISLEGNNTKVTGSVVVNGDLNLKGGTYTVGDADNDVAVYVSGDLSFNGNVTINGVIYVEGTTTFGNGNVELNGSLISVGGTVYISGNVDITFDPAYIPDVAPLIGGAAYSTTDPRIILWREE